MFSIIVTVTGLFIDLCLVSAVTIQNTRLIAYKVGEQILEAV